MEKLFLLIDSKYWMEKKSEKKKEIMVLWRYDLSFTIIYVKYFFFSSHFDSLACLIDRIKLHFFFLN